MLKDFLSRQAIGDGLLRVSCGVYDMSYIIIIQHIIRHVEGNCVREIYCRMKRKQQEKRTEKEMKLCFSFKLFSSNSPDIVSERI